MTFRNAARKGILKSFDGSGRTARRDYWAFFPLGLTPPLLFATQVDWLAVEIWGIWKLAVLFLLSVPLLNATQRRLQDTGEDGNGAYYPFMPFVILWVGYQCILWLGHALTYATGGGAILLVILIWFFALTIVGPLHIIALYICLMITASVIGQLLISSEPGTNRFGPAPQEVSP